jgi:hypothetical protein
VSKPYTEEEKRAILAIVDAYQHYRAIRPPKKRVGDYATESILCVLLGRLSGRMLELDSWRRNLKRWRAELEPIRYQLVDGDTEEGKGFGWENMDFWWKETP